MRARVRHSSIQMSPSLTSQVNSMNVTPRGILRPPLHEPEVVHQHAPVARVPLTLPQVVEQ